MNFAFQMVISTAIRALDVAIRLNRQENTRMSVPRIGVFGAGTMQRQVARGDDDGIVLVVHGTFLCKGLTVLLILRDKPHTVYPFGMYGRNME